MSYSVMISLGITAILLLLSFFFRLAGKLRLTLPLIYFLLTATFLNHWAVAHESLALGILYTLIALSVLSWIISLKQMIRDRKYCNAMKEDISWQIAKAREKGIPFDSVYFDSSGNMRYKDTHTIVD